MSLQLRQRKADVAQKITTVGRLDHSPLARHTALYKQQKALMKTSSGFRSGADIQKMS